MAVFIGGANCQNRSVPVGAPVLKENRLEKSPRKKRDGHMAMVAR
jgi:hypothetical protein